MCNMGGYIPGSYIRLMCGPGNSYGYMAYIQFKKKKEKKEIKGFNGK